MLRLIQILKGKKIKPLTELEAAVKFAVDNAGVADLTIDSALSDTSENPVQNKAVKTAIDAIEGLPTVTAADNGSVLTVVEGVWAAVAPANTTD